MRFTILTKFFLSFLITGILLVGLMIGAMQFYTFQNFGEYVDQIELNKLSDLVSGLGKAYKENGNWDSLRHNHKKWTEIFINAGLIDESDPRRNQQQRLPFRPRQGEHEPPGMRPNPNQMHPPGQPPPGPRPTDAPPGNFPPPPDFHLDDSNGQQPRHQVIPIVQGPGPLEVGPRLSLFDKDYELVMGKARSSSGHVFKPIMVDEETIGHLGLQKLDNLSNPLDMYFIKQQKQIIYFVGVVFLIISVLISYFLASHLLSPIKRLSRATRQLSKRQFDTKLEITTTDELGQLASDFNAMIAKLGTYELKQKQWLSDISHELRTPLSILIGEIDAVQDGIRDPDPVLIKSIQAEVFHLKRLIDDLHTLSVEEAKTLKIKKRPVNVLSLLEETHKKFSDRFDEKGISKKSHLNSSQHIKILGDQDRLIQLFSNIIKNSLRYTDAPGHLVIKSKLEDKSILFYFIDTSPGVPPKLINRIFDRLFRADPSRSRKTGGSGIGLAICKNIVESHGGKISAKASKAGGLVIIVEFPTLK